jgi:hypothetical protein
MLGVSGDAAIPTLSQADTEDADTEALGSGRVVRVRRYDGRL